MARGIVPRATVSTVRGDLSRLNARADRLSCRAVLAVTTRSFSCNRRRSVVTLGALLSTGVGSNRLVPLASKSNAGGASDKFLCAAGGTVRGRGRLVKSADSHAHNLDLAPGRGDLGSVTLSSSRGSAIASVFGDAGTIGIISVANSDRVLDRTLLRMKARSNHGMQFIAPGTLAGRRRRGGISQRTFDIAR